MSFGFGHRFTVGQPAKQGGADIVTDSTRIPAGDMNDGTDYRIPAGDMNAGDDTRIIGEL